MLVSKLRIKYVNTKSEKTNSIIDKYFGLAADL